MENKNKSKVLNFIVNAKQYSNYGTFRKTTKAYAIFIPFLFLDLLILITFIN